MNIRRLCNILIFIAFMTGPLAAQEVPQEPLYAIDLSSLTPPGASIASGTVTFLTDRTLAVGRCYGSICNLQTFDLADGQPHQIGRVNGIDYFRVILRASDGRVVLGGVRRGGVKGAVVLDQDLHKSQFVPAVPSISVSGEKIPEGQGLLLAHATNLAAYLDGNTVRIQGADGKLLGSFEVSPSIGRSSGIVFVGGDRILFRENRDPEIRGFNGAVLRKLKRPNGALGERIRLSEDGTRLLYDSFTRRVGADKTVIEKALVLPSMGMSTDGDTPNGELVRVIDTNSGKLCFEWYGTKNLLEPFLEHADIDPSGRLVAIMTWGTVAIFSLPDTCATK